MFHVWNSLKLWPFYYSLVRTTPTLLAHFLISLEFGCSFAYHKAPASISNEAPLLGRRRYQN